MSSGQERRKGATRLDVARLAGVAPTTVSAVLNGRSAELKLAEATRRRVEDAARQLRYVPNAAARALRRQRSRTLGLLWGPGFRDTITAATYEARQLGYFAVLLHTAETGQDAIATVRDAGIAGLMCPTGGDRQAFGEELHAAGIPVVWLDPYSNDEHDLPGALIGIDTRAGSAALADRLSDRGCRSLGALVGPGAALPTKLGSALPVGPRYQPLIDRFGQDLRPVQAAGWDARAGRAATEELLASGAMPDALFAASDRLAAGAMSACLRAGLKVPDDIAIAGFGNLDVGECLTPALTTVTWPLDELAKRGVRELVHCIDGNVESRLRETLTTTLVIRESA